MSSSEQTDVDARVPVLVTVWRFLTFQLSGDGYRRLDARHLVFGLLTTWVAGMGRNWDKLDVGIFQHLGVGSLIYVFALAFYIWQMVGPLSPDDWSYKSVLTLVTLMASPALLYAIPVEMMMRVEAARLWNMGFVAVVSVWRVALLIHYLKHLGGLDWWTRTIGTVFPLVLVVSVVSFFNAAAKFLATMGGVDEPSSTIERIAAVLTAVAYWSVFPTLVMYIATVRARALRGE